MGQDYYLIANQMSVYQPPLPNWDPLRRLSEVERALARFFPDAMPCRATLIAMCEDGTFDAVRLGPGRYWFVYQSSLDNYILSIQQSRQQKLAA